MKKSKLIDAGMIIAAFYAFSYLMLRFTGLHAVRYSFVYILVYIGIFYILKAPVCKEENILGHKLLYVLAILFSCTLVTGIHFDHGLPFACMTAGDFLNYLICAAGLVSLSKCFFTVIFYLLSKWAHAENCAVIRKSRDVKVFFMALVVIFGCWMLVWLAYYPGLWNYDPWQVQQYVDHNYNKHHPLIHTLLMGFCYSLGLQRNDVNSGVIIYDMLQMLFMAGIFAYTYVYIHNHISGRIFRGCVLMFYAVFPVNSILAISSTKDVIFSGLVLWAMVLLMQVMETDAGRKKIIMTVLLSVACVLMMLFRNNAVYAFFMVLLCICAVSVLKKDFRMGGRMVLVGIGCIALFQVSDKVMTDHLDAADGPVREMFSLPSQQFGRIYDVICESDSDSSTLETIRLYYDMEEAEYNPYLADPLKRMLNFGCVQDVVNYAKDSVRLFCKYPVISIDAFLYVTEGSWYINDISSASIYGQGMESRQGYLPTDIKDGFDIVHESKLPGLELFMEKAFSNNEYQNWPVISLLFSPALYFWILVICTLIFIKTKDWLILPAITFLWGIYLTILLGPCVLIRYFYPFIVCSPLMLCRANIIMQRYDTGEGGTP